MATITLLNNISSKGLIEVYNLAPWAFDIAGIGILLSIIFSELGKKVKIGGSETSGKKIGLLLGMVITISIEIAAQKAGINLIEHLGPWLLGALLVVIGVLVYKALKLVLPGIYSVIIAIIVPLLIGMPILSKGMSGTATGLVWAILFLIMPFVLVGKFLFGLGEGDAGTATTTGTPRPINIRRDTLRQRRDESVQLINDVSNIANTCQLLLQQHHRGVDVKDDLEKQLNFLQMKQVKLENIIQQVNLLEENDAQKQELIRQLTQRLEQVNNYITHIQTKIANPIKAKAEEEKRKADESARKAREKTTMEDYVINKINSENPIVTRLKNSIDACEAARQIMEDDTKPTDERQRAQSAYEMNFNRIIIPITRRLQSIIQELNQLLLDEKTENVRLNINNFLQQANAEILRANSL